MTGKSHLTIGVVTYTSLWLHPIGPLAAPLPGGSPAPAGLIVGIALVMLGALLPDIDHPHGALASERVAGMRLFKPLAWGVGAVFGHRGPTHSLLALAALIVLGQWPLLPWAATNFGWLLAWGYALHLLADALTKSGIPLFWPARARFGIPPFRRLRFATGTWREGLVVTLLALICLANALQRFPQLTP